MKPTGARLARLRRPRPLLEKVEQAHIVTLAQSLGAKAYVLGTRRKKGNHQGTMQTPGIPDLYLVLPAIERPSRRPATALWWEVKSETGARSTEQLEFALLIEAAYMPYGFGPLKAFIKWLLDNGRMLPHQVAHYNLPVEFRQPSSHTEDTNGRASG